jgi:glutamine amidotransferase
MQILFSTSAEFGDHAGLGIIPGRVVRLASAPGFKVPQVGWNRAEPREPACAFWRESGRDFYFVHSFICQPEEPVDVAAQTEYGGELFCSVVNRGKIWGCQFHPERSGPDGLGFLRSFLAI